MVANAIYGATVIRPVGILVLKSIESSLCVCVCVVCVRLLCVCGTQCICGMCVVECMFAVWADNSILLFREQTTLCDVSVRVCVCVFYTCV